MRMIDIVPVTDSEFVSSNIAENDETEYSGVTTYASGNRVMVAADHKIYESLGDSNTGNTPSENLNTWWIEVGATNRWRPFDLRISNQAENASSITYSLQFSDIISAVALFGVEADSVRVQVYDTDSSPDEKVYDETEDMNDYSAIQNFWRYFFEPFSDKPEVLFLNIPAYANAQVDITITSSGTAKVGQIGVGRDLSLGVTTPGTRAETLTYSVIETNDFGVLNIVERDTARIVEFEFMTAARAVRAVMKTLNGAIARPCVYFMDEDTDEYGTTIWGVPEPVEITHDDGTMASARLRVKGLT